MFLVEKSLTKFTVTRSALVRAVGCLQLELDAEGKSGVHMYTVHPGMLCRLFLVRRSQRQAL